MSEEASREKRRRPGKAARNERRKAFATFLNALSVALIVAGAVQPVLAHRLDPPVSALVAILAVAAQAALHYVLGRLED